MSYRPERNRFIIDPVTIDHPKGRVQVAPGTTLHPGIAYMGIDLVAWLNAQTRKL